MTQVKSAAPVMALVPETVFMTSLSPILRVWWTMRMVIPCASAKRFSSEMSL